MKLFDLHGQTAVVIGGTSGIGRSAALALARAGANVVATGRRQTEASVVTSEILALGSRSVCLSSDVTDRSSLDMLHTQVERQVGPVDILVNAAGTTQRKPTLDLPVEDWHHILDINLSGTLRASQVFAKGMIERKHGRIINIASLGSFIAFQEVAAYCASKAGVAALTKSLAVEFAPHGVLVNAVAPGVFPTALNGEILRGTPRGEEIKMRTPMARFGKVEELDGAVVFLASNAASFVTGTIFAVDGGYLASGVNQ